jgi:hypothetical protein
MQSTDSFSDFSARLREFIAQSTDQVRNSRFEELALELFALQLEHNTAYRRFCEARRAAPVTSWSEIPAIPASAFKELELSSLPTAQRTKVFHSSGTTPADPSRHFHSCASLAIYEASLLTWFAPHVVPDLMLHSGAGRSQFLSLTPSASVAPNSSLVHMFETVHGEFGSSESAFYGKLAEDGAWTLDFQRLLNALHESIEMRRPIILLATAFTLMHLLDYLSEKNLELSRGSRVLETGGYKGRSRTLPKVEFHALITRRLGIPSNAIICEYGMSEIGSQAYDGRFRGSGQSDSGQKSESRGKSFQFPPWCRVQIISPETGQEANEGETGLIRIFDLANVYSVMAIQTEDLAIRRADWFELRGRAALAEPRGCSLLAV